MLKAIGEMVALNADEVGILFTIHSSFYSILTPPRY